MFDVTKLNLTENEEERLISVWITPGGQKIKAEILGVHVFSVPVGFVENQWYHVCQSWSSNNAAWNLFIDGHLFSKGHSPEVSLTVFLVQRQRMLSV